MVKSIEDLAEFDELIGTAKKVIVDFTATWCGPCKMIGPIFVKLAETPGGLTFIKVDVDAGSEISEKYDISAMPTFKVFQNGKEIDALVGASKDKLEALVNTHK